MIINADSSEKRVNPLGFDTGAVRFRYRRQIWKFRNL